MWVSALPRTLVPPCKAPVGRSLAPRSGREARCSRQRSQSVLCVSAEPCLTTGPQIKFGALSLGWAGGRALIWMFGFLSPPCPALWKGVLFLLARWRSGSSCLLFCRAPRSPGGRRILGVFGGARGAASTALTSLPRHAPAAPWGTPGQDKGFCLLVQRKITVGISPADLG